MPFSDKKPDFQNWGQATEHVPRKDSAVEKLQEKKTIL